MNLGEGIREKAIEAVTKKLSFNMIKAGFPLKMVDEVMEDVTGIDIYTILEWIPKEQLGELLGRAKCREISLRLIERGDSIESVAEIVGVDSSTIRDWINIENYRKGVEFVIRNGITESESEECDSGERNKSETGGENL